MLAQNFKTPADLGLDDKMYEAHIKVLGMLERGDLRHEELKSGLIGSGEMFNMSWPKVELECGTVACIGGWVAILAKEDPEDWVSSRHRSEQLHRLYYPPIMSTGVGLYSKITVEQAAIALRNFLTFGEARWESTVQ